MTHHALAVKYSPHPSTPAQSAEPLTLPAAIPPSIAAILPGLTDKILSYFAEIIDRIILHGSATDEALFRPGSSDIDLVVLYSGTSSPYVSPCYSVLRKFAQSLTGSWTKIEITFLQREKVERLRNFELCYEGRVCQGIILYNADRPHAYAALPRAIARNEVAEQYMCRTWRWLSKILPDDKFAPWSACRAACSAFHAVLIKHDIDISPKSFRWNLPALFAAAAQYHPGLNKLATHVNKLPIDLAPMDVDVFDNLDREWDDPEEWGENVKLMAASIRIADACGKIIDCKPTYHSMRKIHEKLNKERLAKE
jgi:hypothetical protein